MFHMTSAVRRIGIRDLRLRGREVIDRAKAGEVIEVTDRGRPVARLVPILERGGYDELVAQGLVQPRRRDLLEIMEELGLPRVDWRGPSLSEAVLAERDTYYRDDGR
jgi:prevent-host-death family protein